MIEVTDWKGDYWALRFLNYNTNTVTGTMEAWMTAIVSPLPNYPAIPVPVFTEWWPCD